MEITVEEQVKNAIKWIDELPNYKQALRQDRARLGDSELGYCCIGAGCVILNIPFDSDNGGSGELAKKVGLYGRIGRFMSNKLIENSYSLASLNDNTEIGFIGIQKVMKTETSKVFKPEVAKGITNHYNNLK